MDVGESSVLQVYSWPKRGVRGVVGVISLSKSIGVIVIAVSSSDEVSAIFLLVQSSDVVVDVAGRDSSVVLVGDSIEVGCLYTSFGNPVLTGNEVARESIVG